MIKINNIVIAVIVLLLHITKKQNTEILQKFIMRRPVLDFDMWDTWIFKSFRLTSHHIFNELFHKFARSGGVVLRAGPRLVVSFVPLISYGNSSKLFKVLNNKTQ